MDTQDYYMSKDGRASFPSALAAAHFFEDRFCAMQATFLVMSLARHKQDIGGVKVTLQAMEELCSPVEGLHADPRSHPPLEEETPP